MVFGSASRHSPTFESTSLQTALSHFLRTRGRNQKAGKSPSDRSCHRDVVHWMAINAESSFSRSLRLEDSNPAPYTESDIPRIVANLSITGCLRARRDPGRIVHVSRRTTAPACELLIPLILLSAPKPQIGQPDWVVL